MAQQETLKKLKDRRLERMRLGQSTAEIEQLPSDKEVRVALVPLLEKEYDAAMRSTALIDVPDNIAGAGVLDRQEKREVLVRAIRDPDDYTSRIFDSVSEMMEILEPVDVSHLYDRYVEMSMEIDPAIPELSEEEIDFLRQSFGDFNWRGLSGRQLYALNRFILTLSPNQLVGRLPGSFSTS